MRFSLLYVSDKPSSWVEQVCDDYQQRLPSEFKFSSIRISAIKRTKSSSIDSMRDEEWSRIQSKRNKNAKSVLLDERGQMFTSKQFAQSFADWQQLGQDIDFIIAGADGVNAYARKEVDMLLALSKLTFPHELARVIMLEQIYRAWSIMANHPYHRE